MKKYFEKIITTSIVMARRTTLAGNGAAAATFSKPSHRLCIKVLLYHLPTPARTANATNAATANHPTAPWPCGITIMAANSGPIALPPFPPTWNIDCARLFLPPEAICATRDDQDGKWTSRTR